MSKKSKRAALQKSDGKKVVYITAFFYSFAILNEFLAIYAPFYSAVASALVIFLAVNLAAWNYKTPLYRILPVLALIPFMRLLSLVLPLTGSVPQLWYLLVSLPVLTSLVMILRSRHIPLAEIGLGRFSWTAQLPIALTGLPLGFIAYLILRPQPLFPTSGWIMALVNLAVIFFFIAFTEEVLFRGIILRVLTELNERFAPLLLAVLYASLHVGSKSPVYALYMGIVGWLFFRFARQTGSIWGVIVANFLLVAGLGIAWPMLLK
jgi:membrane protease YdiL (CAAX protease family)